MTLKIDLLLRRIGRASLFLFIFFHGLLQIQAQSSSEHERVYKILTRQNTSFESQQLLDYNKALASADLRRAALGLAESVRFEKVLLRPFTAQFSERESSPRFSRLDDLQATMIYLIRSDSDFREILTGRSLFSDNTSEPIFNRNYNNHLDSIYSRQGLSFRNTPYSDKELHGGIQMSRKFFELNYVMGTNRRQVTYIFDKFLCSSIDDWKNPALSDFFIRPDIDRAPGKDSTIFEGQCRSCHAPLDSLANAHIFFDLIDSLSTGREMSISRYPQAKTQNRLSENNPGRLPQNNYWVNFLTTPRDMQYFGWRGPLEGAGVHSFGQGIVNSKRFELCMAKRVFETTCPGSSLTAEVNERLAQKFVSHNYRLKPVFVDAALESSCQLKNSPIKNIMALSADFTEISSPSTRAINPSDTLNLSLQNFILQNQSSLLVEETAQELSQPTKFVSFLKLADLFCDSIKSRWGTPQASETGSDDKPIINTVYQTILKRSPTPIELKEASSKLPLVNGRFSAHNFCVKLVVSDLIKL